MIASWPLMSKAESASRCGCLGWPPLVLTVGGTSVVRNPVVVPLKAIQKCCEWGPHLNIRQLMVGSFEQLRTDFSVLARSSKRRMAHRAVVQPAGL